MSASLLPRARLLDVIFGRAPLVGSRLVVDRPRGFVSPVEAQLHLGLTYGDAELLEAKAIAAGRTGWRVALRGLLTSWLAASRRRSPRRRYVVASPIDDLSIPEARERILEAPGSEGRVVHFVHAHALNLAARDASLRAHLQRAHTVLGDGVGLQLASRLLGAPLRANVNGTDLLPSLCEQLAQRGVPLVLIGAAPGVAARCARELRRAHPDLQVPLVRDGFLDAASSAALRGELARVGRCVVLVGMGSPRQEAWCHQHLADLANVTVVTVGGLFDFYSGRIPRAPLAWRELGLEWVWRLRQEPRRLASRYLLGNPAFLARALRQRLAAILYVGGSG